MREVYLDNSATTKVCDESAEKILEVLTKKYGNPSSLHGKGIEAEDEIRKSRKIIADYLSCDPLEIYFTSGGTESNNLAILGVAKSFKKKGSKVIATAIEHPSVIEPVKSLSKCGFEVKFINPDENGIISEDKLYEEIDENTVFVSIMLVNNELGSIQDIRNLKKILKFKNSRAIVHMDAVQGFGKIPINISRLGADIITFSAHKIHGPKGVGGIYISKDVRLSPMLFGGNQERSIRPGTESSALIAGFGAAVEALPDLCVESKHISELNLHLRNRLSEVDGIKINSSNNALPYILNFSVGNIKSETLLHYLSSLGIYVSSGSACSKGKKSHVLSALGLSDEVIDSSMRVSFSRFNKKDDVDVLVEALKSGIPKLAKRGTI